MTPVFIVLSRYKFGSDIRVLGYSHDPRAAADAAGACLPTRDYIYQNRQAGHSCGDTTVVLPPGGKETYDSEGNLYRVTYDSHGNLTEFWTEFGYLVWVVATLPLERTA